MVKKMSPAEYLSLAVLQSNKMRGSSSISESASPESTPLVEGDVHLFNFADRHLVTILPPATIIGNLLAHHCPKLKIVDCSVSGAANFDASGVTGFGSMFSVGKTLDARACGDLKKLSGHFPSVVCLEDSAIEVLADDFSCDGDLFLGRCPRLGLLDCKVGGSLHAEGSAVSELGPSFFCSGDLRLNNCKNLKEINMVSGPPRDVLLTHSGIVRINPSFFCTGSLVLTDVDCLESLSGEARHRVEVEAAPRLGSISSLSSRGRMEFSFCPMLTTVDFKTSSSALFHECSVQKFSPTSQSSNLTVRSCGNFKSLGGNWSGDVTLVELMGLERLDPSFACEGNLMLRSCPNFAGLSGRVGKNTTISKVASLEEITSSFWSGGNLILACSESRLKNLGCTVEGDLTMTGCDSPFSTSNSLIVSGEARFLNCPGMESMRGRIRGNVFLTDGTGVKWVGAGFEGEKNLIIKQCHRLELLNCRVAGNVLVENSSLNRTGPAFFCGGRLSLDCPVNLRELKGRVVDELVFFSGTQKLNEVKMEIVGHSDTIVVGEAGETNVNKVSPIPLSRSTPPARRANPSSRER